MNRNSLYLEIGNIDDDLILEAAAASAQKKHRSAVIRLVGLAACLCLICTALLLNTGRDTVYYNDGLAPITGKLLIPSGEHITVLTLTEQDLFDYYNLIPLPEDLSGLHKTEQPHYFVYQSSGHTIFDTNLMTYRSEDGSQELTILLSSSVEEDTFSDEYVQTSNIDGVSLILGTERTADTVIRPVHWARLQLQDVSLRIVSSGINEDMFTQLIRTLIQGQR